LTIRSGRAILAGPQDSQGWLGPKLGLSAHCITQTGPCQVILEHFYFLWTLDFCPRTC
jgi:hypothetical protein